MINLIIDIFMIVYGYIFWHLYALCEYLTFKVLFEIKIVNIGENSKKLWDQYFKNGCIYSVSEVAEKSNSKKCLAG